MLELRRFEVAVIGCYARAKTLEELPMPSGAVRLRVASDEALLVGRAEARAALLEAGTGYLAEADSGGLALDVTDGFAAWTLGGEGAEEAFRRLSAVPLPGERPALLQGLVAHLPAKVIAEADALHVLVSSTVGHHLRERVLAACRDLKPREASPAPLFAPAPVREASR